MFKDSLKAYLCTIGVKKNVFVQKLVGWSFPKDGWVKFNVDEACNDLNRAIGCGVMRDASGAWIVGSVNGLGLVTCLRQNYGVR